jgi:hypothetical protein
LFGGVAFRIHDSGVCGEIDNRMKGIVRSKIWVAGCVEPVVLNLSGNARPDLLFENNLKYPDWAAIEHREHKEIKVED